MKFQSHEVSTVMVQCNKNMYDISTICSAEGNVQHCGNIVQTYFCCSICEIYVQEQGKIVQDIAMRQVNTMWWKNAMRQVKALAAVLQEV